MEWLWGGGLSISWHLFREFKSLSQSHSKSTEEVVTPLAQMETTNPSYFLKVQGNNGDDKSWNPDFRIPNTGFSPKGHAAFVLLNCNETQ